MPGATLVAPEAIAFGDGGSRDQTSLYSKIDIFFPVQGNGDSGLERSRKQMLNSLLSLPAVAGEVFRSLDATPFSHSFIVDRKIKMMRGITERYHSWTT